MTPLQPFSIAGYNAGLQLDRKPFLLPDQAFPVLYNAYNWRERIKKRECNELVGRLRKTVPLGNFFDNGFPNWSTNALYVSGYIATIDAAGLVTTKYPHNLVVGNEVIITNTSTAGYNNTWIVGATPTTMTFTIPAAFAASTGGTFYSNQLLSVTEPDTEIEAGSFVITINGVAWTDNGDGTLSGPDAAKFGVIDYTTGIIQIQTDSGVSAATTLTYNYFPGLPVMGIRNRELPSINFEQTVFFDTRYTYTFDGVNFNDVPGVGWSGADDDFFWTTNYQGADSSVRVFFVTNNFDDIGSPMRYTLDNATYTDFAPQLVSTPGGDLLLEARILIPYYGRLIALNTIEGTAYGLGGNRNFFNRARFSQEGNPLAADAWHTDVFGKGGFADAPTSEAIVSATLFKNTLIVRFERSTWQLRYMGNYGTPFLFERISSDFGCESTFSSVLFDTGDLAVGNRAISVSTATTCQRIDENIPDIVFTILNKLSGPQRVHGIRDYRKELVFWNYNDANISAKEQYFPNQVLVYNYRDRTWAIFRDNVTVFGNLQPSNSITWDSTNVFWDDEQVLWDSVSDIAEFPRVVIGNQMGYILYFGYKTPDDSSLTIEETSLGTSSLIISVPNHNIADEEIVYIKGIKYLSNNTVNAVPVATDLNNKLYLAERITNTLLKLYRYDFDQGIYISNFDYTPHEPVQVVVYIGGGSLAIMPRLDVQTKDFNPYAKQGNQTKISYIDFLTDVTPSASMTVNLFSNTYLTATQTINTGNELLETYQASPYFGNFSASNILWHRFYYTLTGQMIRIQMTYNDVLMNTIETHQQDWQLNAMTIWARPGGKSIF